LRVSLATLERSGIVRRIVPALALLLAVASLSAAGVPTKLFYITASEGKEGAKYLAVREGRLSLGSHTGGINDAKPDPCRWYVLGTQIKSSGEGLYLAYDPSGEVKEVSLAPKPDGALTEWVIRRGSGEGKNKARNEEYGWASLQAASGPLKGYFLDVERLEGEPEEANAFRFVLREKPAWNVEVSRIYTHK